MELFANDAQTTITSGGTTAPAAGTQQTWTPAATSGFPAASSGAGTVFHVADPAAPSEVIAVTNVSGGNWTVTRGADGTAPVAHQAGFTVVLVIAAGVLASFASGLAGLTAPLQPSGDLTGAADTAALQAAAAAGQIAYLVPGGVYYVNAPVIFPAGSGLVCEGSSLAYYGGSTPMPLEGAIITIPTTGNGGFTPSSVTTAHGTQALSAPIVMVSQNLGNGGAGYATGSANQMFRGITIDGRNSPNGSGVNGIEAWGPVWGVKLLDVGVFGCSGDGVHTSSSAADNTGKFPDFWQVRGCHFAANRGAGANMASVSDSYFVASEATGNSGNGWTLTGDNIKMVGCKAEYNSLIGLLITRGGSSRPILISGFGTDGNARHGIQISGAGGGPVALTGCGLNFDGTSSSAYAALSLTGATHVTATGLHITTADTSGNHPATGILCSAGFTGLLQLENCEIYGITTAISNAGTGTITYGANVLAGTGVWSATTGLGPATGTYVPSTAGMTWPSLAKYAGVTGQSPRESIPFYAALGNLTVTSGVMAVAIIPVQPGDVISNVGFVIGLNAAVMGTGPHWWTALYSANGSALIAQSADQGAAALASASAHMLALGTGAPYTVPGGVTAVLGAVMINVGTSGTVPNLRGGTLNPAQTDSTTSLFPTSLRYAGTSNSALGAGAPVAPLTIAASGNLVYIGVS